MTVLARLRVLTLAATLVGFTSYGLAEGTLAGFVVLACFGIAGWWITEGRRLFAPAIRDEQPTAWPGLPRWVTNVVLVGVVIAAAIRGFAGESVVSAFLAFLAAILVLKLWERRELRDYGQLLTLSLFLTLGTTLNTNALGVGLCVMLIAPILAAGAMQYQLVSARARARELAGVRTPGQGATTSANAPSDRAPSNEWKHVKGPLRLALAFATVAGAVVAVVVFVFTPRGMGGRQFGEFARVGIGRVSGFVNQVDLQSVGMISQSPEVVMEVELTQPNLASEAAKSQEQFGEPLYLRGLVLDEYANGRWRASTNPRPMQMRLDADRTAIIDPRQYRELAKYMVTVLAAPREWAPVFHVDRMVHVQFHTDVDVMFDARHRVMQRRLSEGGRLQYTFSTLAPDAEHAINPLADPDHRGEFDESLDASPGRRGEVEFDASPTVNELARAILADRRLEPDPALRPHEDDRLVARAFEAYLRSNYEYTLDPPRPPRREDATAWFLREGKRGHCEFFASSLAALCRSVGIDARVVAGYLTSEYDPARARFVVRAADAHAWVEVNEAPDVWKRYDATPEALPTYRARGRETLLGSVRDWFARVEGLWNSSIVSFDNDAQRRLFAPAQRGGLSDATDAAAPSLSTVRSALDNLARRSVLLTFAGIALIIAGVAGLAWLRKLTARRSGRRAGGGWAFDGSDAAARLHARIESTLQDLGHEKPDSRPLRAHLATLSSGPSGPPFEVLAALNDATNLLYAARFGERPDARAQLASAESRVVHAARQAKQSR